MFTSCGEYEIGGGCDGIGKEREGWATSLRHGCEGRYHLAAGVGRRQRADR